LEINKNKETLHCGTKPKKNDPIIEIIKLLSIYNLKKVPR